MNSFGELDNFQNMISWLEEIQGAAGFLNAVVIIAIIIIATAFYVVTAFKWQFIGRKAGLQKDWMPFVPFARTVYRLSIVEEQWWENVFSRRLVVVFLPDFYHHQCRQQQQVGNF